MEQGSTAHRHLPFDRLKEITNSFSDERKLGRGAYGIVYKGECEDGETIAVKVFHESLGFIDEQFDNEYLNLASLQHQNIVRVVAYCHETQRECVQYNGRTVLADNTKRAVCYEYMQNGCLNNYLSDESSGHDWQTRYQIIKGICNGMKYLHEDLSSPMYHLDLKPANILLDQNFVPKIADFGMSRLIGGENTQLTKSVIGTRGYQPPEYIDAGLVSNKFDIYSLGVVIIKIMTGPMGYFRTAEMSSQDFIELVHANWMNRLLATSIHTLESSSQQVKRCIELALSCVDANRRKRPCMGVIINKLIETEDMIPVPGGSRKDTGSSMNQICDLESSCIPHVNRLIPVPPNTIAVSRDHIVSLFNSANHRLSDVPENPWILKAGTATFADPCELTNESTGIWIMKLKTTAQLVGLSERELHEQNWELCGEVREECLEQLLEVAYTFSDARWSVGQITHQLTIFDALVEVLFNIRLKRPCEVAGILNKMVNAFKGVMQGIPNDNQCRIESGINPATVVLIQILEFFSRNREMGQAILLESGDCNTDPCLEMLNCLVRKLQESAELMFQDKATRYIFLLNNIYYVLQTICRPELLLPNVGRNIHSLARQYAKSYIDECWYSTKLLYLDGDSLNNPCGSSVDKFIEDICGICDRQMALNVQVELKYILRAEIKKLIVQKYGNFIEALQKHPSARRTYWLQRRLRTGFQKRAYLRNKPEIGTGHQTCT